MSTLLLAMSAALSTAHAQVPVATSSSAVVTDSGRQGGPLGLGIAVGAPSGLAGRFYVTDGGAIQFSLGGDLGRIGDLALTGDAILLRRPFETGIEDYNVLVHGGAGVNLGVNSFELAGEVLLGVRAVGGITIQVQELPIDISIEMAPTLYLYDAVTWSIDGGLCSRYYF
jgi:hypothetical protein